MLCYQPDVDSFTQLGRQWENMRVKFLCIARVLLSAVYHTCLSCGQAPEFYHSTDEISEELQKLSKICPELSIRREPIDDHNYIDVASISRTEEPVSRFFLLAGEHARELISTESALHFVKGEIS